MKVRGMKLCNVSLIESTQLHESIYFGDRLRKTARETSNWTTLHKHKHLPMKRQAYFSGKTAIVTFPQSFDRVRKFKTSLQLNRKSRGRARSGLDTSDTRCVTSWFPGFHFQFSRTWKSLFRTFICSPFSLDSKSSYILFQDHLDYGWRIMV